MKRVVVLRFMVLFLLLVAVSCVGQNTPYRQINMEPPAIINFKTLADSQLLYPIARTKRFIEQGEDRFEDFKYHPPVVKAGEPVFTVNNNRNLKSLLNSSPPVLYFDAIQDYGILIPPDIQGAAGIDYLVETTNQEFDIYNKQGAPVAALSLINFFSATGGSRFFDPHILYDAPHGRYIICSDGNYRNGNGGLFVGVSQTADPTGNWYVYSFDAIGNDTDFIDYPELGFNNKWVVLTANNFIGSDTVNAMIYVLRSDSLYAGNLGTVKTFTDTASFSIVPAQTNDTTQAGIYLVHDANGNQGGNGYMQIGAITGPVDAPVYNFGHAIGVNQPWSENIVNAVQQGGDNTIEDGDTRVMNGVIFSGGSLWFTHSVFLPADTPTHTGVDWWQIDPANMTLQQFGRLEDTAMRTFYYYPSLAVNAKNDMVLGYCISSTSCYPGCAYSFRFSTDAVNTLRNTYIYKFGMGSYDKTFGGHRNRWGDFTGTVADPVDSSFWNFNEYSGITNSWGTAIAHIADGVTPCKTHADFVYSTGISCGAPFSVNFTNLSTAASTHLWDFGDGAISVVQNPTHIYSGPGVYSVKLLVADSVCGADSLIKTGIIQITDDDPTVLNDPSVCAGASATLYATGPGIIRWYNAPTGGTLLDTGTVFVSQPVNDTAVFYAETQMPGPATTCGPLDNNFGTGSFFGTSSKQHLVVFDCKMPQRLVSVDVYSHGSGFRNIQLLDPNNTILGNVNPFLEDGLNTVMLNFDIPVDHDLKLTTHDTIDFYYNLSGATYPYYSTDSTLVLIHSDQVTTTNFFYFYNWKLETYCISNRTPALVTVINPLTKFDYDNVSGNKVSFIPANTGATCHWLFGDGTVADQQLTSHSYASAGIYPVTLIEQLQGCTDTIIQAVAVDTSNSSSLKQVQSMFVFPDPVYNKLNVQVGMKESNTWTLLVRNILGQTVISQNNELVAGVNNLVINVAALQAGVYFVSLRNGKAIATRKFVVDR